MSPPTDPRLLIEQLHQSLRLAEEAAGRIAPVVAGWGTEMPSYLEMSSVRVWLQDAYAALETLMERFVKEANGEVPHGAHSHAKTLERSFAVADRPGRLWSEDLRDDLKALLSFRHFSHHGAYEVPLDPAHLRAHAERVARIMPRVRRDLDALAARLVRPPPSPPEPG